jgi:hypothetical protein
VFCQARFSTGRSAKVKEKSRGFETKRALLTATYYQKKGSPMAKTSKPGQAGKRSPSA